MRTISQPFRFDGYGKVVTTTDPSKVWADRTKAALTTPRGTRIMQPDYGSGAPLHMFDNSEESSISIDSDVASAFEAWLPDLSYKGVYTTYDPDSSGLYVTVNYSIPNAVETSSLTLAVEY